MDYQALYRMFRPQSFEDVVGQEHVTKTLKMLLLKVNSRMLIFLVGHVVLGKRVSLKYLPKRLTVKYAMMANRVMNVQVVKESHKGTILM